MFPESAGMRGPLESYSCLFFTLRLTSMFVSRLRQIAAFIAILILIGSHSNSIAQGNKTPTFESEILPVLKVKCIGCHSGQTPQAKLDLQAKPSIITGGQIRPELLWWALPRKVCWSKKFFPDRCRPWVRN